MNQKHKTQKATTSKNFSTQKTNKKEHLDSNQSPSARKILHPKVMPCGMKNKFKGENENEKLRYTSNSRKKSLYQNYKNSEKPQLSMKKASLNKTLNAPKNLESQYYKLSMKR